MVMILIEPCIIIRIYLGLDASLCFRFLTLEKHLNLKKTLQLTFYVHLLF